MKKNKSEIIKWQKERPDKPCIFVVEEGDDFEIFKFVYIENADGKYLAWVDNEGYEYDDITECNYDRYLILEWL